MRTTHTCLLSLALVAASAGPALAQAEGPAAPTAAPPAPAPDSPYDADPAVAPDEPMPSSDVTEAAPGGAAPPVEAGATQAVAPAPLRRGAFVGASFGLAGLDVSCDVGCRDAAGVGFTLDAGWAMSERFAVLVELWFGGGVEQGSDGDRGTQLVVFDAAVRYWLNSRLWLQGGLGGASLTRFQQGEGEIETSGGGGLALGAGVELWRAPGGHMVVDLRARVGWFGADGGDAGSNKDVRLTSVVGSLSWY